MNGKEDHAKKVVSHLIEWINFTRSSRYLGKLQFSAILFQSFNPFQSRAITRWTIKVLIKQEKKKKRTMFYTRRFFHFSTHLQDKTIDKWYRYVATRRYWCNKKENQSTLLSKISRGPYMSNTQYHYFRGLNADTKNTNL